MKQHNPAHSDHQAQSNDNKVLSRRKFLLQATAVSVPTVMSLKSGSAWGCVKLNCAPGEESLSNSGSQVASVTEGPNKIYERPRWPTMANIRYAFTEDFVKYLLGTYNEVKNRKLAICTPGKKSVKQGSKWVEVKTYTFTALPFADLQIPWWEAASKWDWSPSLVKVFNRSPGVTVYTVGNTSNLDKVFETTNNLGFGTYNKDNTLMPAMFNGTVITDTTPANVFSKKLPTTKLGTLINGNTLDSYVVAAIVGAMWERHPSYKGQFDATNPNRGDYCFPSPEELIAAYEKVIARSTSGRPEDAKAKDDMLSLFKLYMVGIN